MTVKCNQLLPSLMLYIKLKGHIVFFYFLTPTFLFFIRPCLFADTVSVPKCLFADTMRFFFAYQQNIESIFKRFGEKDGDCSGSNNGNSMPNPNADHFCIVGFGPSAQTQLLQLE